MNGVDESNNTGGRGASAAVTSHRDTARDLQSRSKVRSLYILRSVYEELLLKDLGLKRMATMMQRVSVEVTFIRKGKSISI